MTPFSSQIDGHLRIFEIRLSLEVSDAVQDSQPGEIPEKIEFMRIFAYGKQLGPQQMPSKCEFSKACFGH
jgi:hypothetical protein